MMLLIMAMAGSLASAGAPSAPTTVSGVAASAVAPAKPADDSGKVVCREDEVTGSRFIQRVCKTKGQWAKAEQAAANYKREIDDRGGLQGKASGPFGN